MNAWKLLKRFEKKGGKGAFTGIKRADVAKGIRERVAAGGAGKIDQGWASLCGPAALMFCLVNRAPGSYIKYVTELYDKGKTKIGQIEIKPSPACKKFAPPKGKIPPVDWVALASLRDSENLAMTYASHEDQAAGITTPGSLASWFRKIGYRSCHDRTQMFGDMCKTRSHIIGAGNMRRHGYDVCLFINTKMLYDAKMGSYTATPNHWIVLTMPKYLKDDMMAIKVFTWAEAQRRVPKSGNISVDTFLNNYYGYVCAHL